MYCCIWMVIISMEISNEVRAHEVHERATAYYKTSEQFAYKFLMEVKAVRDEKLYKTLGFSNFEDYASECFGYTRETITNRIQTAEVWGQEYVEALRHYGRTKTRQLGIMPELERKKVIEKGIDIDGEIKTIEQATTREVEAYQKQLKEKEEQIKQKDQEIEHLKNTPPKVIEKEVVKEVVPEDYNETFTRNKQLKEELEQAQSRVKAAVDRNSFIEEQYQRLLDQRKEVDAKSKEYNELSEAIQEMEGKMTRGQKRIQAQKDVYDLVKKSKELLLELTPIPYVIDAGYVKENEYAKKALLNISDQMNRFLDNLHEVLDETNFIEGEIIHG